MRIVGLTGGIASGKSTVSKMLSELGAEIIDADKIAREVVKPGEKALRDIVVEFGSEILNDDGTLNRKKLGGIVFNDRVKLERLNEIIHPEVKRIIKERLDTIRNEGRIKVAVVDAPVLLESGSDKMVDEVWVVYIDHDTQKNRLMIRDKISAADAEHRIVSQMSYEEKIKLSDRTIDNSRDLEHTRRQVLMLWYDINGQS